MKTTTVCVLWPHAWGGVWLFCGGWVVSGWVAARQGRQDLHMASGISSTRQAATRVCLCELVGIEGPSPCSLAMLATVLGWETRCMPFFWSFFSPSFVVIIIAGAATNHHQSELRLAPVRLIPPPFFLILRFQHSKNAPTHGTGVQGLAWRLSHDAAPPPVLSHVSCLLSWLLTP